MNMARSTFYKRPHAGHRAAREKADTDLRVRIEDILAEFPAYGYRRVTHELRRRGLVINHKRVARVMREHALTPHRVRAWLATTNSDHKQPIYPNLRSSITPEGPRRALGGRSHLHPAHHRIRLPRRRARRVVAQSHRLCHQPSPGHASLPSRTRRRTRSSAAAGWPGSPLRSRGPVCVSSLRLTPRRPRYPRHRCPGGEIPMNNAHVESFFKTLKHEEIFANDYSTIDDLTNRLPHFLEEVYNRRRLHSSLGYRPPEEFESVYAA